MAHESSDRRVGEVLTDDGSDLEEALDPNLLARLAEWFSDSPSVTLDADEAYREERERVKDKAAAAVDPAFHSRLEEQGAYYCTLIEPLPPLELNLDRPISNFDLRVWQINEIGEAVDYERPDDLRHLLQENAPQAVLRDLHRPVRPLPRMYLHPTKIAGGGHPHDMVADLMTTTYKPDMAKGLSPTHILCEDRDDRAEILAQPWENSKPDKPASLGSPVPDENDMLWFGAGGVDYDQ